MSRNWLAGCGTMKTGRAKCCSGIEKTEPGFSGPRTARFAMPSGDPMGCVTETFTKALRSLRACLHARRGFCQHGTEFQPVYSTGCAGIQTDGAILAKTPTSDQHTGACIMTPWTKREMRNFKSMLAGLDQRRRPLLRNSHQSFKSFCLGVHLGLDDDLGIGSLFERS